MTSFKKKCPSCNEVLPFGIKDKVQCRNCKKWVKENSRVSNVGAYSAAAIGFLTSFVDWRLTVILVALILVVTYLKLEYEVIEE